MRHETYIDVLKSVFLTVVCLVFFPLLLPAISPSQDPNGCPENLLIFGEEEEERSASIHNVDSLSGVSSDANGAPENLLIFGEEEEEQSASIHHVDSLSDASSDDDMSSAVDVSRSRDIETSDVASDDADWYVPAEIPIELRAPMRASAAECLTDSILTFNQDSVLTEATTYDYDAAGRTIRTTVWQYATDGSRTGKSKQEYAFDANGTQIYTGTFAWDAATNDWKGTAKSEYVYNEAHKMESNITYTWVNNTWLPSQALTYAYDAAGRETEFTTYTRNASLNRLVPSKQRLQTWYNASMKTLEINYTAYTNGAWSAGTKKVYAYDAAGNQTEYTYFSSYSNGNWVGSTQEFWTYNAAKKKTLYEKYTWSNGGWVKSAKEVWEYNTAGKQTLYELYSGSNNEWVGSSKESWEFNTSGKQTLHEKFTWSNNDWTISLREISGYDAAGNNNLVENYSYTNGVTKGTKKEEYTYNDKKKKTNTITYKWTNGEWVNNVWTVSGYDAAGNANETCKYNWKNDAWVGTGTRTLKTFNSNKKVIEQIAQTWPSGATDWVNSKRSTTNYTGTKITQEASFTWTNDAWLGTSRKDYHYNAAGQNDTTKTYTNNGTDWIYSARTVNTYDAKGNTILTHNASWNGTAWVMTTMNRLDVLYDAADHQILNATWRCTGDSVWIGVQKDSSVYSTSGKRTYFIHYASYNADTWVPDYCVENAYDDQDRSILVQRFNWVNNVKTGNFRYEYGYDAKGNQCLSAIYYNWNATSGTWVGSSKSEQIYNENNKLSISMLYVWGGSDWTPLSRTTYAYDNAGREIENVVEQYNSAGWEFTNKYTKEYCGSLQVKNNAYVWLNNQWKFSSREESYYDNDSQSKLRRQVNGYWSSGVVSFFVDNVYFYSCDAPTVNNGSQPRTPTEIEKIEENYENNIPTFDPTQPAYNLQGQSVDPAIYHGIVIQNGKKYILR